MKEIKNKDISEEDKLKAQERLLEVMNDKPRIAKLNGTEWEIKALRPKVQWMICEEVAKIKKIENLNTANTIKEIFHNYPSVVRIITLALLNDKKRIENEYDVVYDTIFYETTVKDWAGLLVDIVGLLEVDFFLTITSQMQMFMQMTTEKKMTMREAKLSSQGQNGGK